LRTLVLAYKEVSKQQYDEWAEIYHNASTSIDNREERVESACEIIETDMLLLGCTGIEDKLQDEVPQTISYLLEAGIQIWVLTGDKQETAINIGYSSKLFTPEMDLIIVNAGMVDCSIELLNWELNGVFVLSQKTPRFVENS
jgi:P-type E1-E2 ATPase